MSELKKGDFVKLQTGGSVKVKDELGRGGQGIVYLVDYNGNDMALKWYHKLPSDTFYKNLKNNVEATAPSNAFIWPEYITTKYMGSFGYVMKLRPKGYYEFSEFLLANKTFKSVKAMLNAAMIICDGFKKLHDKGFSYQDLNDGNFFIRPEDGDVLICDNDNVMPNKEESGIKGKSRYMAPEVVLGKNRPDKYSDRFSLSVILFLLFYNNHPFEGKRVLECPCLTEKYEKEFYGSDALFIYDEKDSSNRPVKGIHNNVLNRWPIFHPLLNETFIQEFSQEKLKDPSKRIIEGEWKKILQQVRAQIVYCDKCGEESFTALMYHKWNCVNCKRLINVSKQLTMGKNVYILTPKTELYFDDTIVPSAIVGSHNEGTNFYYTLENISNTDWSLTTASGNIKTIKPHDVIPVRNGMKIKINGIIDEALITTKKFNY